MVKKIEDATPLVSMKEGELQGLIIEQDRYGKRAIVPEYFLESVLSIIYLSEALKCIERQTGPVTER
ncbi:MAG: hypothetical protein P8P30_00305 [Rickettsiales bacterium]|nr:hypothetical protein [Rickettsiales bacterium]